MITKKELTLVIGPCFAARSYLLLFTFCNNKRVPTDDSFFLDSKGQQCGTADAADGAFDISDNKDVGRSSNPCSNLVQVHTVRSPSCQFWRETPWETRTLPRKVQLLMQTGVRGDLPICELGLLYKKSTTQLQYVHMEPKLGQDSSHRDHIMTQFKHPLQQVPDRDGCTICTVVVFLEISIAVEQLFVFICGSVSLASGDCAG
jgi:hypothetical protein